MASEQGPVVTEASLQASQHAPTAVEAAQPSIADAPESNTATNPLKRSRDDTPASPTPAAEEPSYKAPRFELRSTSPIQLTAAAAALEAERRRREEDLGHDESNSGDATAHSVLEKLIQSAGVLTQPPSTEPPAPAAPTAVMDAAPKQHSAAAESMLEQPPVAPESSASTLITNNVAQVGLVDASQPVDTGISGAQVTESPTPMDIDPKLEEAHAAQQQQQQENRAPITSLSYPGPHHTPSPMPAPPARTLSYPLGATSDQGSPTSPETGTKRHKCPFCDTVFTRHHNLKSHLLTHSQEKPYECEKCKMRFRRLHDLKRHSKLHTGEKPHICPKCDRKFARGDALARHSKGAGGCAGRRSSMGSFAEDDMANSSMVDGDDSQLSAALYTKYATEAAEEARRRQSLPVPKAPQVVAGPASPEGARAFSGAPSRSNSGLFPPASERNSVSTWTSPSLSGSMVSGHTSATSISSMPVTVGSSSYAGVTESPQPLSPAVPGLQGQDSLATTHQAQSPGLTQQSQQQQPQGYTRRDPDRRTPPASGVSAKVNSTPDGRYLAGQNGQGTPQPGSTRTSNGAQVIDSPNMFAGDVYGLWTYIQNLEERISQMEKTDREKQVQITTLNNDVAALRKELEARPLADPAVVKQ
ncbi:hypothetical protein jhhlp_007330 [Lomentospora prolificans]|uniref:C2H2-type domain-containing protein n=1 Tax=Lomentospora prolificans TaxID=41688 RepID=A0A2N3N2E1_9PEZI|nr:hypothetical protein jhhlp_007330 [Lomentospora prolificans]